MRVPSKTPMERAAAQIDAARAIRLAHGISPMSRSDGEIADTRRLDA